MINAAPSLRGVCEQDRRGALFPLGAGLSGIAQTSPLSNVGALAVIWPARAFLFIGESTEGDHMQYHTLWPKAYQEELKKTEVLSPQECDRIAAIDAITDELARLGYCRPREEAKAE